MIDWQVLSFETSLDPQKANVHPPIIEAAQNIDIPNGSAADFCVLVRFRPEGEKVFRDYYFSPAAILLCGPILAHGPGRPCERPSGPGLSPVKGQCTTFILQSAGAS